MPKKILLTGSNWMLSSEFLKKFWDDEKYSSAGGYKIYWFDSDKMDITKVSEIESKIFVIQPDLVLNLAAYTNVDDAEDIWEELNLAVNADWVKNLAEICWKNWIDFITISTDFVFNWEDEKWYWEEDLQNPVNAYWYAKLLWEKNAKEFCENSIIIRTSWLYWWWKDFKNFVNSMISFWKKIENWEMKELWIVWDQFWNPTYCLDLVEWIWKVIENIEKYRWKILHFSNDVKNIWWEVENWVSWFDFAEEIFLQKWIKIWEKFWNLKKINASSYKRKAKTPKYSMLRNNSDIKIWDWKIWLKKYLNSI
jgi:dTDP-4-dehydrorhamnose reductase